MSYRLIALKYPILLSIALISSCAFFLGYIQNGKISTSPNVLNNNDFPYITGNPATGPIFPNPKIAVPSVTIAEIFFVFEYGFCYCVNFRRDFYEKNGLIKLMSRKFN
jgi:hypothetical protein